MVQTEIFFKSFNPIGQYKDDSRVVYVDENELIDAATDAKSFNAYILQIYQKENLSQYFSAPAVEFGVNKVSPNDQIIFNGRLERNSGKRIVD